LVGEDLYSRLYAERLSRFGQWDMLAGCGRDGCLDSSIRRPAANDFDTLHRLCPELETVVFNGQTSGKFAPQFGQHGFRTVVLPSSPPAHMAQTFEQKLQL
jgi:hypoxanthine-DNA glycosylase